MKQQNKSPKQMIGLTMQFMVGLSLFVFLGYHIDRYFGWTSPIAIWMLPLIFIFATLYTLIRQTGK
ncbi:MAG: hypothetical protein ACKO5C_05215 [Ferruginibacter sp.]